VRKLIRREVSPFTGIETRYLWDDADKKLVVQRIQDIEPQLDVNRDEYNSYGDHKASRYKDTPLHKVATIPPGLVEQWMKEGFNVYTATDQELRRRLNDPQYRKLRTMPGRL